MPLQSEMPRMVLRKERKEKIYPFNPHIFPKELFLPSEVTKNDTEMNKEQMDIAGVPENITQNVEGPSSSPTILTGHGDI
ncbi:hypothetical protein ILUMI_02434 [Ignelater luminosus]|uniref:Uncharacterized protein n=1 Tax=Ignelater luminosus TaxID=2038154 RepID=A0A8K0DI43_IGNLU|nr:hypothetical protein ILUMI_02434 [Ignelater luminosus]